MIYLPADVAVAIYASCQYTRQLHEEAVRLEVLEPKGDRDSFYV